MLCAKVLTLKLVIFYFISIIYGSVTEGIWSQAMVLGIVVHWVVILKGMMEMKYSAELVEITNFADASIGLF